MPLATSGPRTGPTQRAPPPGAHHQAGDLELSIPKLRRGSFFPSLLEPRRRIDRALYAVVMEAYVHGVSTRGSTTWSRPSVEGGDLKIRGQPHLCGTRRGARGVQGAPVGPHAGSPTSCRRHLPARAQPNQVTSNAVVVATGVTEDGRREFWASRSAIPKTRPSGASSSGAKRRSSQVCVS